uniref:P53 domain-containing protein n=1 Tax=Anisakis simplex TaxID=6269 RepID=A0A0M3JFC5_ANISI
LKISVEPASKRKTSDYVFQSADRMLFARPFVYIPFIMELKRVPPADAVLQIMACYSRHEHSMVAVKRCAHHLSTDDTMIREHFIQCEHQSAVYVNCATPNDPSFIMLPLNELFSSLSPLFIPLKFTCFSSCTGGINRRAVHISFVLKSKLVYD